MRALDPYPPASLIHFRWLGIGMTNSSTPTMRYTVPTPEHGNDDICWNVEL